MIGRSRKREEVLVSPKLMPLGVSSSLGFCTNQNKVVFLHSKTECQHLHKQQTEHYNKEDWGVGIRPFFDLLWK